MRKRSLKQALRDMDDEEEQEELKEAEMQGKEAGAEKKRRSGRMHPSSRRADLSLLSQPAAVSQHSPHPSSGSPHSHVTPLVCADGDDELSGCTSMNLNASAGSGRNEAAGSARIRPPTGTAQEEQQQQLSSGSSQAEHQLSAADDSATGDESDGADAVGSSARQQPAAANGATGAADLNRPGCRRRHRFRSANRARSRSTRRRVFPNSTFNAESAVDSDDSSDSSDGSQASASLRMLSGRTQLCDLLVGGRCRSLRGLMLRTTMQPNAVKVVLDDLLLDGTLTQLSAHDSNGRTLVLYRLQEANAAIQSSSK